MVRKLAMAMRKLAIMVLILAAVLGGEAVKKSRADDICNIPMKGLMSCKPYVSGPVGTEPPSSECCSALSNADLPCLCNYKFYMSYYGIDPERAMQLPLKCNLSPPNC